MQSQKKYLGDSKRSTSFVRSFKIILKLMECFTTYTKSVKIFWRIRKVHKLCTFSQDHSKLVECFTNCGKSEKISGRFRKVHKLSTFIQNHSEASGMFYNVCKVRKSIQETQEILKLLECFTTCTKLEKISRRLRKL